MRWLILLILFTSCGKVKIADSNQNLNVNDSVHRVDVVHSIDFQKLEDFFRPDCERDFKDVIDDAEREELVDDCVNSRANDAWDLIISQGNSV